MVSVPATTANIGPGFDCLGAALSLHNRFTFSRLDVPDRSLEIVVSGADAERVQTDASNLVYQAFAHLYNHLGQPMPPVHLKVEAGVPLARGLGSSATAIVGGLIGANALAGFPLRREAVMHLAIAMEGHPDNVVPALLGGCQLITTDLPGKAGASLSDWVICEIPWDAEIVPIVAIPNFELSTQKARSVLPTNYSRQDAIFNAAHLGLLMRALQTGNQSWLSAALQDRLHQPYRQALIPGYEAVYTAAMAAGACGLVISGAGPALLALAHQEQALAVEGAMATAWKQQNIGVYTSSLKLDIQGAVVHIE
jgi:homoserine kinase